MKDCQYWAALAGQSKAIEPAKIELADQPMIAQPFSVSAPDSLKVVANTLKHGIEFTSAKGRMQWKRDRQTLPVSVQCTWACRGICFFPLSYSALGNLIVKEVPKKDRDFAPQVPRHIGTGRSNEFEDNGKHYKLGQHNEYMSDYGRSFFGITERKAGWDANRHYEILEAGTMPYFVNLDKCPKLTLFRFPKMLVLEAMHLQGVDAESKTINHEIFNRTRYFEILNEVLEYTRKHLTAKAMARYMLESAGVADAKSALFINIAKTDDGDYMREELFVGFRLLLGDKLVDYWKETYMYTDMPDKHNVMKGLYGWGWGYAFELAPMNINRTHIHKRIERHEFDVIIYGGVTRSKRATESDVQRLKAKGVKISLGDFVLPPMLWQLVTKHYRRNEILLGGGMDIWKSWFHMDSHDQYPEALIHVAKHGLLFLRESENSCAPDYIKRPFTKQDILPGLPA